MRIWRSLILRTSLWTSGFGISRRFEINWFLLSTLYPSKSVSSFWISQISIFSNQDRLGSLEIFNVSRLGRRGSRYCRNWDNGDCEKRFYFLLDWIRSLGWDRSNKFINNIIITSQKLYSTLKSQKLQSSTLLQSPSNTTGLVILHNSLWSKQEFKNVSSIWILSINTYMQYTNIQQL